MRWITRNALRVLLVIGFLALLVASTQVASSREFFSTDPLPTLEATLEPGVEWVTVRNLPVDASTIWEEQGQVFGVSRPLIEGPGDAAEYRDLVHSRLALLSGSDSATADVTFMLSLSLEDVEIILEQGRIVSLFSLSADGSSGRSPYPPPDVPSEVEEGFSQAFETLSGGTPAPDLEPDNYLAAQVRADAAFLRQLAVHPFVFTVDIGPIDLKDKYAGGTFYPVGDTASEFEGAVGSVCTLDDLIRITDEYFEEGAIDNKGVYNSVRSTLENAKRQLEGGRNEPSGNMVRAYINEAEAQRGKHIQQDAADEMIIIAECVAVRIQYGD